MDKFKFIEKAQKIHGLKYDYSKLPIIFNITDKIKIICPIHGEFEKRANNHLSGQGCKECGIIIKAQKISKTKTKSTEQFIKEAKTIHDPLRDSLCLPRYDYSKVKYINSANKVKIICPIHGEFEQLPNKHLIGQGCKECGILNSNKNKCLTNEQFIEKSQKIHGLKYDYSKVKYINSQQNKVKIICPIHGEFEQLPWSHLCGSGCKKCSNGQQISKSEINIQKFIEQQNIKILTNNRQIIYPKEIDIFIPEKHLGIEFDGIKFHSELFKPNDYKTYHLQKTINCEKQGIHLIHIFEDEWLEKQDIVKARLLNLLGKNKFKIGARKCKIKQVHVKEERNFLNNNHLQGYVSSTICYGLYWLSPVNNKEYLVALMSFGPLRKNLGSSNKEGHYELYRFVTAKNFSVPGGASRLFKHFVKKFNPKQVISFADRRWSIRSDKNLYESIGFKFDSYTEPGYFYVQGNKRINRFALRKDVLIKEYGCSPEQSEHEFCQQQGWPRIYDCGQLKYIWNQKQLK